MIDRPFKVVARSSFCYTTPLSSKKQMKETMWSMLGVPRCSIKAPASCGPAQTLGRGSGAGSTQPTAGEVKAKHKSGRVGEGCTNNCTCTDVPAWAWQASPASPATHLVVRMAPKSLRASVCFQAFCLMDLVRVCVSQDKGLGAKHRRVQNGSIPTSRRSSRALTRADKMPFTPPPPVACVDRSLRALRFDASSAGNSLASPSPPSDNKRVKND